MKSSLKPSAIQFDAFKANLDTYQSLIPNTLDELEDFRFHEIPELLGSRQADGEAFLEKAEVSKLIEWKLKHGTFRPTLRKLVASNGVEEVRTTTLNAFATYAKDNASHAKAITTLSKLKGIGPASASLILATYDPINVPFFSDELYRYLQWSEAKGKGWDRKINYTIKEYTDLYDQTQALRQRLAKESGEVVKAVDLEKMAYAIGKEAQRKEKNRAAKENEGATSKESPETSTAPRSRKRRRKQMADDSDDSA